MLDLMLRNLFEDMGRLDEKIPKWETRNSFSDYNSTLKDDKRIIKFEIPGFSKDNVKVDFKTENGWKYLTIHAEREDEYFGKQVYDKILRMSNNEDYDLEKLEAKVENGILYIIVPLSEKMKPKQIPIN